MGTPSKKGSLWCDSVEEAAGCLHGVFDKMPGLPDEPAAPAKGQYSVRSVEIGVRS